MNIIDIILHYKIAFFDGLLVTLRLASIAWISGLFIGTIIGALANRYKSYVGNGLRAISFLLAAIPPIVIFYWAHYPMQEMLRVVINPFITASFVLSLINIVVVSEIVRSALDGFKRDYRVSAMVSGMTRREAYKYIELPLIFRQVIPTILAAQVFILQSTLFASLISVEELFRVAQRVNSVEHRPIEIYTALALFYLLLCLPLYLLSFSLRKRFMRKGSH